MIDVYSPDTSLTAKVNRRLMPLRAKRSLKVKLDKPLISITFDDCPKSVVENALPLLEIYGWQATFYMAMGLCGTTNHLGLHMSEDDVKAVHKSGHEIGGHTFDHIDATAVTHSEFETNIEKNQIRITELGLPPSQTFAYPYGQLNLDVKKSIHKRFSGARGITSHIHTSKTDLNQINSNRLYSGQNYETLLNDISIIENNPGWMTIFTHDVRNNPSDYGCHPDEFANILSAIKKSGADVMTMADAIKYLEQQT